jgi:hypothetical protein
MYKCYAERGLIRGVDNFFKTRVANNVHSPSLKTTGPIVSERGKKNSPGWPVGLYFYSLSLNSTRIWRVGEWLSAPLDSCFTLAALFYDTMSLGPNLQTAFQYDD